ncbi:MAG: MOSC N-terminal beta barrel domain-containing protein [Usitatibacter sp.]
MTVTVSALHVYPVKGLGGIDLDEAYCTDRGLRHDRRWMVVDEVGEFITQRDLPKMATVWTDLTHDSLVLSAPDFGEVDVPFEPDGRQRMRVRVWKSTCDALPASSEADAWLTEYLGHECKLVYMPEGTKRMSNQEFAGTNKLVSFADGYAYLVTGEASLEDLNNRLKERGHAALPMNRFRPNIVVKGAAAYAEDSFGEIAIGEAILKGAKPCGRCQVTTTDQATGEVVGPEPLATLTTYRESSRFGLMFGMNLVTVRPGRIAVGDIVKPT